MVSVSSCYVLAAQKIHCSKECKTILSKVGGYKLESRGLIDVKVNEFVRINFSSDLLRFNQHSSEYSHRVKASYKRTSCFVKIRPEIDTSFKTATPIRSNAEVAEDHLEEEPVSDQK